MTVTGMANLAVKVSDLDAAIDYYRQAGGEISNRIMWNGSERADVQLGALAVTLFTAAIYEDSLPLADDTFLHPALFTDDLDAELARHTVLWGPTEVSGPFGRRRIAFVEAPGNMRLEFMEQLEDAPETGGVAATSEGSVAGRSERTRRGPPPDVVSAANEPEAEEPRRMGRVNRGGGGPSE